MFNDNRRDQQLLTEVESLRETVKRVDELLGRVASGDVKPWEGCTRIGELILAHSEKMERVYPKKGGQA